MAQTHSLQLNGTTQYANISNASQVGLNVTTAITLEAWVKFNKVTGLQAIATKYENITTGRQYGFYTNGNKLRLRASTNGVYSSTTFREWETTTNVLTTGTWFHIAMTLDVATEVPVFYVDGNPQSFTPVGGGTALGASLYSGTADFIVGSNIISGSATDFFDGLIKDVRIFGDVRTEAEIVADLSTQNVSDVDLAGEWNFNEVYTDTSGNSNTLAGVGSPTFSTDIPAVYGSSTPTVTTQAVTDIAKTTATGNGNVTADGGETITERGVAWSTTATPTTADSKATSAGTTGAFTAAMTGLTASTLYYVRAYAINSVGTSYGSEVTFTTLALDNPTVTTQAATLVGSGGATLNGNVTSKGDFDPVNARFQYRATGSGTWLETSLATDVTTGAYTFGLTGLTPETEYEFRAKVEYDTDQEAFGDTLTFTTLAGDTAPAVTTNSMTAVRATLATANGEVTSDGGQTVTERGFVWATTTAPDVTDNKVEVAGTTGAYSVGLTTLPAETLVYLRAYAINSVGTSYGNEVSFTTLALSAVKNPMYRNDGGVLKRIN